MTADEDQEGSAPEQGPLDASGGDPYGEFEIPTSIVPPPILSVRDTRLVRSSSPAPGVVSELSLDFEVPDEGASGPPMAAAAPSEWRSSPPAEASSLDLLKSASLAGSLRAPAVPDLEVPRAPARPAAHSAARASVQSASPSAPSKAARPRADELKLEVDYGSTPLASAPPPAVPSQRLASPSLRAPLASAAGSRHASPVPVARSSAPPARAAPAWGAGGLGDFSSGLDDLDMAGSLRAAQLDVAVALPKSGDDGPWPTGRTPADEDMEVGADSVRRVGYGAAPASFWGTPAYALRIARQRPRLEAQLAEARDVLVRRELARDEKLAALAEQKRSLLMKQERFATLFAVVDACTAELQQKTAELESLDRQGSSELRALEHKLAQLKARRLQLEAEAEQVAQRWHAHRTHQARQSAALKRLQIEERNLTARFDNDGISEADYELQAADIKNKMEVLEQEMTEAQQQAQTHKRELDLAENQVRLAVAEQQHQEGVLEAHLIALEGKGREHTRSLAEVKAARLRQLAEIGRAVMELKGQVPVEPEIRAEMGLVDGQVKDAALARRKLHLALGTVDEQALRLGRGLWIGGGVILLSWFMYWLTF